MSPVSDPSLLLSRLRHLRAYNIVLQPLFHSQIFQKYRNLKAETTVMQVSCSYTVNTVHILNIPGFVKCPGAGKKLTVKCPGAGNFFLCKCPGVSRGGWSR